MAASSRLGRQITEIVAVLDRADAPAALIGGLALASHGVVRATQDVDFLTDTCWPRRSPTPRRSGH